MNDIIVVSSLRINKLFGKHDLRIDFKKLNVIVGKNGVGKTTLLKIIHDLISGNNSIRYSDICESIELIFPDGNVICYGTVTDGLIESATNVQIPDSLISEGSEEIADLIDMSEIKRLSEIERQIFIRDIFQSFLKTDAFTKEISDFFNKRLKENHCQVFQNSKHISKLKSDVNLRYISTVNISANSLNNKDIGNSIEKNILDLAIYEELRQLLKNGNKIVLNSFIAQLNAFLHESGKTVKRYNGDWVFINESAHALRLDQLSSGERQLVYILATAANTCGKPTLFLMDEPEVSLHLSWQEKIIDSIMAIHPQIQIIAVTHSPGIIMNGHMDAYVEMKNMMQVSEDA